MTLVSFDYDFIYLRTRKTGSTSTEEALVPLCLHPGDEWSNEAPWPLIKKHVIVGRMRRPSTPRDLRLEWLFWNDYSKQVNRRYWNTHQSARRVRFNLGRRRFDRMTKVTTIRNPFTRAVSLFFWEHRRFDLHEDHERAILGFRHYMKTRFKETDHEITHIKDRFVVDVILRQETLENDLKAFVTERGMDAARLAIPREKMMNDKPRPSLADLYDEATADIVREKQAWVFREGGYDLEVPTAATR